MANEIIMNNSQMNKMGSNKMQMTKNLTIEFKWQNKIHKKTTLA